MTFFSRFTLVFLLYLLSINSAFAHAKGEDYVFINVHNDRIEGNFQINITDLRDKLGIPVDNLESQGLATVEENRQIVFDYIKSGFRVSNAEGQPYDINFSDSTLTAMVDEFVSFPFQISTGKTPTELLVEHNLFYENDKVHRGLLLIEYNAIEDKSYGPEHTTLVFSPGMREQTLDLTAPGGLLRKREMVTQGALHIWGGIDHVLFIVTLLLPVVLVRAGNTWRATDGFVPSLRKVIGIVTIFTIAHSATLLLAALGFIELGSRLVESIIALSIILVALNNIFHWVSKGTLVIIFCLGLFHGLGFASVMGNLPFRMVDLVTMVVLFNIGVELGQIAIVAVLFPILYTLRTRSFYVPGVLVAGSWLMIAISGVWFVQRVTGAG